eukprot:185473_1
MMEEDQPEIGTHTRNDSKVSVSLSTHSNAPLVPTDAKNRASALDAKPQPAADKSKPMEQNTQPQSNNPQADYISFFKAKLKDPKLSCLCKFCTIWLSAHVVMLFVFFDLITGTFNTIVMFQMEMYWWPMYEVLFLVVTSIIFVLAFRGLYVCNAHFILAQYILCWFRLALPFSRFLSELALQSMSMVSLISFIVGVAIAIYSLLIWRIVYLWSKYFKNNGKYDVNMVKPNNDKTFHFC